MKSTWVYRILAISAEPGFVVLHIVYWPLNVKTNASLTYVSIGLLMITAVSVAGLVAVWSEQQGLRRQASQEGGRDGHSEESSSAA